MPYCRRHYLRFATMHYAAMRLDDAADSFAACLCLRSILARYYE